jgi:hypothetical protein
MRQSTHMHVIGGSGTGKSKFLEHLIRKDMREGQGLCVIDWHGTLYQDILAYCAHLDIGLYNDFRQVILLNPSDPDFITGFNPFMNQGRDVSVQVSNRVDTIRRVWGMTDPNTAPTFERVARTVFTFAVEHRQTLPIAAMLLDYDRTEVRNYALQTLSDNSARNVLRQWQMFKSFRDWRDEVLSTDNRFNRFVSSSAMRRFLGLSEGNIDLREIMDKQKILLINLGSSDNLDRDSARVFAALFLKEFFETAMRRATIASKQGEKPKTFVLYLDEFQEYITEDIAAMLDQVRKGGLHLTLAHQHLGHLADDPRLRKSIFANARIRTVFGGLDYEDASILANEMFLPDLNTRQIKKAYYHTIHLYREETRNIYSKTSGHSSSTGESWASGSGSNLMEGSSAGSSTGETIPGVYQGALFPPQNVGWFSENKTESSFSSSGTSDFESSGGSSSETWSESEGESIVPVWVPIPVQELGSEAEWSREEKVSKVAEMLKCQQQRHCFIKLDTEKTQPLKVPFVKEYSHSPDYLLEYQQAVYQQQGALPAYQVDQLLIESEQKFLTEAQAAIDIDAEDVAEEEQPKKSESKTRARKKPKKPSPYDDLFNNPTDE